MTNHVWEFASAFVKSHVWEIALALVLALLVAWILKMNDRISDFIKSFFPVKLKVDELAYWHIERPEPEHHAWHHCHEYNFAGEITIIPKAKTVLKALYLNLPIKKGFLRVDVLASPPKLDKFGNITSGGLSKIAPDDDKIVNIYSFQVRCESKIRVPSYAYIIMQFKRGKVRHRVSLREDDDYRFKEAI